MPLNISKCEIDKDNQLSPFFDLIILGRNNIVLNSIIDILSSYGIHAEKPTVGFCYLMPDSDLNKVINLSLLKGSKVVLISMNAEDEENLQMNEVHAFSNNLNPLKFKTLEKTNFIGFQRHFSSLDRLIEIESNGCFASSLGLLTSDILSIEPELRIATNLYLDFNICKSSFLQNIVDSVPTGIDPESLIQAIRFAAHSPYLKSIVFNTKNFDLQKDCKAEFTMIAECLWYFMEGLTIGPFLFEKEGEKTFASIKEYDVDIEFSYSQDSNKYWVSIYDNNEMTESIPCTNAEYIESTQEGQLSARLVRKFQNYL